MFQSNKEDPRPVLSMPFYFVVVKCKQVWNITLLHLKGKFLVEILHCKDSWKIQCGSCNCQLQKNPLDNQRRIQRSVNYLRKNVLEKQLKVLNSQLFRLNTPSMMFYRILNIYLAILKKIVIKCHLFHQKSTESIANSAEF